MKNITEDDMRNKLSVIADKLSNISGYYDMIETLHMDAYKICEELGIEDTLGYDISECDNSFDYEKLSCDISNTEDEWIDNINGVDQNE